jgi:hypothetical protein
MHVEPYCSSQIKPVREQRVREGPSIFNNAILLT